MFEKSKKSLTSDARDLEIGAVILHKYDDGTTKRVVHASRSLIVAEKNYSQIEKEALAIIFAMEKFHKFLRGWKLLLQTNHRPLFSIYASKKGVSTHTANRLQCWGTILLN